MGVEFPEAGPKIDGKIVNDSYSQCAPRFRPRFLRYVRHEFLFKLLLFVAFGLFLIGAALGGAGESLKASANHVLAGLSSVLLVMGGLSLLLGVKVLVLTRWLWKKTADLFENGLLTPGIVLSPIPLEVAVMASMSNGSGEGEGEGEECWGIRRLKLSSLPAHDHDAGTRIPFVSTFTAGEGLDRWADFDPTPISYGTGSARRIEGCTQKLGKESFDRLAECIRHGLVPLVEEEITLVDEHFHRLETIPRGRSSAS